MMPVEKRSSRSRVRALILLGAGLLLIVISIASFVALSKPPAPTATFVVQGEDPLLSIPRVTLADAKSAYDSGSAVFLDVRGDAAYQQDHIPGALSIDVVGITTRISELNPQDWIIPYCT